MDVGEFLQDRDLQSLTSEGIALGKMLFYDTRLSRVITSFPVLLVTSLNWLSVMGWHWRQYR